MCRNAGEGEMSTEALKMAISIIMQPPPPIVSYDGIFNLSDDVLLYDENANEYKGHAVYGWRGEDDAPQIADWENFVVWHIEEDGEDCAISNSIVFWQYPTDTVMESAFAALATELEAQGAELLQELMDLWDVWEWATSNSRITSLRMAVMQAH